MKKSILIFTLGFFLTIAAGTATAQQGQVELGGIINNPSGLSIKGWISNDVAIDGALSFYASESFSTVHLHSDILFHNNSMNESLGLTGSNASAYYGAGLQLLAGDFDEQISVRIPGGITYQIENTPLVTFFEVVPTIDVKSAVSFGFGGAVGARFYLN